MATLWGKAIMQRSWEGMNGACETLQQLVGSIKKAFNIEEYTEMVNTLCVFFKTSKFYAHY